MFSFRLRFSLPPAKWLPGDGIESRVDVSDPMTPEATFVLKSLDADVPVSEASSLALIGRGYPTSENAEQGGRRMQHALLATLASNHMSVDFGSRRPQGGFNPDFLQSVSETAGRPVLHDREGLMIYQTTPSPILMGASAVGFNRGPKPSFMDDLQNFVVSAAETTEAIDNAYDTYAASFFTRNADARLVQLVTAVEYLIDQDRRSDDAVEIVDAAIAAAESSLVDESERRSLVGSLAHLTNESIGRAGKRLVRRLHQDAHHLGVEDAERLWSEAYSLRSALVHGKVPRPDWTRVASVAGSLEVMVGDLIGAACLEEARRRRPLPEAAD